VAVAVAKVMRVVWRMWVFDAGLEKRDRRMRGWGHRRTASANRFLAASVVLHTSSVRHQASGIGENSATPSDVG
jgi:hypothetical protein